MKKVTLSSESHSARRRGCTLVVNLNPDFSFISTTPAGIEALNGEIILHIPDFSQYEKGGKVRQNTISEKNKTVKASNLSCQTYKIMRSSQCNQKKRFKNKKL